MCVLLSMARPQHAAVHVQIQERHRVRREAIAEDACERVPKRRLSPLLHSILNLNFLQQKEGSLRIKAEVLREIQQTNTISRKFISCVVKMHL